MRTFTVLIIICWLLPGRTTGQSLGKQSVENKSFQEYQQIALKNKDIDPSAARYENISGSPFYYEKEMPADLVFHNDQVIENIPLQIDLYAEEFVVTNKDGQKTYLDLDFYKEIRVVHPKGVDTFKRVLSDQPRKLFLVLYEDDETMLIKDASVRYIESSVITPSGREVVNKFDRTDRYQLVRDDAVIELTLKKKKFFKAFPEEIADYLRQKSDELNLSLKKEEDFIRLVSSLADRNE